MPFNLERSTVNVKELIDKIRYDYTTPIVFQIDNNTYQYYDVVNNNKLLMTQVNKIKIFGKVLELNEEDLIKIVNKPTVKNSDISVLIPNTTYYYMITIQIN
jgi:hypothetical protein